MTLTGLESVLIGGAIATGSVLLGVAIKSWFRKSDCEKCGIEGLRMEIRAQSKMIRLLAEKAGVTVKEQLEIEAEA